MLIKYGANIHITNKYNNTPLHVAGTNGNVQIVTLLLENKANIFIKNYVRHFV